MRRNFEGGVYRDEFAETCGEILRAVEFRGAVRFRGNTVILNPYVYSATKLIDRKQILF